MHFGIVAGVLAVTPYKVQSSGPESKLHRHGVSDMNHMPDAPRRHNENTVDRKYSAALPLNQGAWIFLLVQAPQSLKR